MDKVEGRDCVRHPAGAGPPRATRNSPGHKAHMPGLRKLDLERSLEKWDPLVFLPN